MADEAGNELTMEQELEQMFSGTETPAPAGESGKGTQPKPGEKKAAVASPPPSEDPDGSDASDAGDESEADDPLKKKLDEIEEESEGDDKDDKAPKLSDEQQQILRAIPDAQTAANLYQVADNYKNFTGALETGKFEEVEGMLNAWNPQVREGWLEHVYQKYVATGEWVDRFCEENDPKTKDNPVFKTVRTLQKEIQELKSGQQQRQQNNQQEQQTQRVQQAFKAYNDHITGLFDQLDFNKADRKWVMADLNAKIAADPKVLESIRGGNVKAANKLFKAACREYIDRDKEVVTGKEKKLGEQGKHKPPLASGGGGAQQVEGELPDDVRQVPKDQEENWMRQQLGKLFGGKKK